MELAPVAGVSSREIGPVADSEIGMPTIIDGNRPDLLWRNTATGANSICVDGWITAISYAVLDSLTDQSMEVGGTGGTITRWFEINAVERRSPGAISGEAVALRW